MATNKIELAVSASQKSGKGPRPAQTAQSAARQSANNTRQALQANKSLIKSQTDLMRETKSLIKSVSLISKGLKVKGLEDLSKKIDSLSKTVSDNTKSARAVLGKTIKVGGAAATGLIGGGIGGAVSSVGKSMPYIGGAIVAGGYVTSKFLELGQASRAALMEQSGTAGIAGPVGTGVGIFDPTQNAEYIKTRRMQSGRLQTEAQMKENSRSYRYAARFGDLSGVANIEGLMDRLQMAGGGAGGEGLNTILERATKKGGIETDLPIMMGVIEDALETAVENGVRSADIGMSVAREITQISSLDPTRSMRSIQKIVQSGMQRSANLAKGQFGAGAFEARMTSESMTMLTKNQGLRLDLAQSLGIDTERAKAGKLSPAEIQTMISMINEGSAAVDIRGETYKRIATEAGSASAFTSQMQQMYQSDETASSLARLFYTSQGLTPPGGGVAPPSDMLEKTGGGVVFDTARIAAQKKSELISNVGARYAREAVNDVDTAFLELAQKSGPLLKTSIQEVSQVMNDAGVLMGEWLKEYKEYSQWRENNKKGKNFLQMLSF